MYVSLLNAGNELLAVATRALNCPDLETSNLTPPPPHSFPATKSGLRVSVSIGTISGDPFPSKSILLAMQLIFTIFTICLTGVPRRQIKWFKCAMVMASIRGHG